MVYSGFRGFLVFFSLVALGFCLDQLVAFLMGPSGMMCLYPSFWTGSFGFALFIFICLQCLAFLKVFFFFFFNFCILFCKSKVSMSWCCFMFLLC